MPERTRELSLLIIGDIAVFIIALLLTLAVRYVAVPSEALIGAHLWPFLFMSLFWVIGFFIGGLYDKQITPVKANLIARIINTQLANVLFAGLLFLVLPFGITPKTNLAIYLFISIILLTVWRRYLFPKLTPTHEARALLLASGPAALELVEEINGNTRYPYYIHSFVTAEKLEGAKDAAAKMLQLIKDEHLTVFIVDATDERITPVLSTLYHEVFIGQQETLYDFVSVYEATFDKVPLTTINYAWCIGALNQPLHVVGRVLKRVFDIVCGTIVGLVLLVLLPFVWLANRIEGKGPLFIDQQRAGQFGKIITVYKLRTMTENRSASSTWAVEDAQTGNKITRVGAMLRKLSIDELPQALTIIRGEMSLIGPRADIAGLSVRSAEAIPFYDARLLVKPGLSGWAQTNQRYEEGNISPQSFDETRERLAYDLYYIKNQSLLLEVTIVLKTIKALAVRAGSLFR